MEQYWRKWVFEDGTQLNFSGSIGWLLHPATIDPIDICAIGAVAVKRAGCEPALVTAAAAAPSQLKLGGGGDNGEFDEMESLRLWVEMAEAMLLDTPKWGPDGNDVADGSSQS
uniref:Uncharacterized protein n=1 Tax=Oryza punctata TaxID=4537 RepID=A0A0E0KFZ4_ORYPU